MSDPDRSEDDDVGGGDRPRRPINWNAVAAIVSAFVGLLAIVVSAYTAWGVRQQTRAESWPHIVLATTGVLPAFMAKNSASVDDGGGLFARNSGVGPAIVRRAEILVNGKPEPGWPHAFKALGYPHRPPNTATSDLNGQVLSPGQKIYVVAIAGNKEWLRFEHKVHREVVVRTCYCSVLGECWIDTWKHSLALNKRTQPVDSCAKITKEDEFNG